VSLWPLVAVVPCLHGPRGHSRYSPLSAHENLDSVLHQAARASGEDTEIPDLPAEVWKTILGRVRDHHVYRLMLANSHWLELSHVWPETDRIHLLKQAVIYSRDVLCSTSVVELFALSNLNLDTHALADSSRRAGRRALKYVKSSSLVLDLLRRVERRAVTYHTFGLKGSFAALLCSTIGSLVGFFISLASVVVLVGTLNSIYAAICGVHFILPISTWIVRLNGLRYWIPLALHTVFATAGMACSLLLEQGTTNDFHGLSIAIVALCVLDTLSFSLSVLGHSADLP
jgi:hypothetical protein